MAGFCFAWGGSCGGCRSLLSCSTVCGGCTPWLLRPHAHPPAWYCLPVLPTHTAYPYCLPTDCYRVGLQLVLSAALELADEPTTGLPAILVLPLGGSRSSSPSLPGPALGVGKMAPWRMPHGRGQRLLAIECREHHPLTCVLVADGSTLLAAGALAADTLLMHSQMHCWHWMPAWGDDICAHVRVPGGPTCRCLVAAPAPC